MDREEEEERRKGQKLIGEVSRILANKKLQPSPDNIEQYIWNMSSEEFDDIINTPDGLMLFPPWEKAKAEIAFTCDNWYCRRGTKKGIKNEETEQILCYECYILMLKNDVKFEFVIDIHNKGITTV